MIPGYDISGNIVDIKVELDVNNKKVTIHAYNTTQNVKVEGVGYLLFVENFLKPILVQRSQELEDEIEDINNEIIEQFGQNNQTRRAANTWKERMTKNFNCDECDFGTTNKIQLKTHINKKHMKIKSISSNKANRIITYLD